MKNIFCLIALVLSCLQLSGQMINNERAEAKKRLLQELRERYDEVQARDWINDRLNNTVFLVRKDKDWGACVGRLEIIPPQYSSLAMLARPSDQIKGIFVFVISKNDKHGLGYIQDNHANYEYKEVMPLQFEQVIMNANHTGYFDNRPELNYINVKSGGKWGVYLLYYRGTKTFSNVVCEERIKPKFEAIKNNFYHGYALVKQNGNWGIIGESGKELLAADYDSITETTSFCRETMAMREKNKWGLFDLKTNKVIAKPVYDSVTCEDLNYVKFWKEGKPGVFSKLKMQEVNLSGGKVKTDGSLLIERVNSKWILYNKEGLRISDQIYDTLLHYNYRFARSKANGKTGLIDKLRGSEFFPPIYDSVEHYSNSSGAIFWLKQNGKWGFADTAGKIVVMPKYEDKIFGCLIDEKARDNTVVKEKNKWGMINIKGETIAPFKYDNIFTTGSYQPIGFIKVANKSGIIDIVSGKEIISPLYDELKPATFKKNLQGFPYPIDYYVAKQKDKTIYLNAKGEKIPEPKE